MAIHPAMQRKAQKELDDVVGSNRLPDFDDYGSLPYIRAFYLECTRRLPVLPLGIAHRASKGDYYQGLLHPGRDHHHTCMFLVANAVIERTG